MNRILIIGIFFLYISIDCISQTLFGKVLDEDNSPIEYATVILLNASDSSMLAFSNSARDGAFTLEGSGLPLYILQISYLGYETFHMTIANQSKDIRLDPISMKPGTKTLDVIEVKDYASPMTFGKDTLQYNASAFKTQPGDMAEDLLKKLPGLEVERDGSVKALGERVQNVMVDGKEFFGKDTKIATKNIDADAIDKVQVFDKKSDQTEFTGIDDGQRERSINLKLKEDRKAGYFGTAEWAAGSDDRFKGRANVNRFTPSLRTSFIGLAKNVNEQNFSINDYIDFMGGIGALMGGNSGGNFTLNLDQNSGLPIGLNSNQGIQKSFAGGFNLSSDFSSKSSLEASVFGNHFKNKLDRNSLRENFLPESRFITNTTEDQISENTSGSFTLKFKAKPDSIHNLVINASGSLGANQLTSKELNQTLDSVLTILNDNANRYTTVGDLSKFSVSALWQKKTSKPGRILTLNSSLNFSNNHSDAYLNSLYEIFYPAHGIDTIVQNQQRNNDGLFYNVQATWTEPLNKRRYLEFESSVSNQNHKTSSDYFDLVNDLPIKNIPLSQSYRNDFTRRHAGLNFIVNREKYNFSIGGNYQYSTLSGHINNENPGIRNHYSALLPQAFFTYRFGLAEHLNFNYFSQLNEPAITQLQPTVNNSNPLAIYNGNPILKPEKFHAANLSYMRYNAFDFTMLYLSLQSNFIFDKITEGLTVDSTLVRYYQPVNIRNEYSHTGRIEYETPIRPLKIKARAVIKGNYNRGYTLINQLTSKINRRGYGYHFSLENRNKDMLDLLVGYKYNFNESKFSADEYLNQNFKDWTLYTLLGIQFNDRIHFKSSLDYMHIQSSFSSEVVRYPLWTVSISAFVTKNKKLRLSLSCFDLLNKNQGITTSSQYNYTDVTRTNILSRYFLLGLSYNIKGQQKKSGIEINLGGRE